VLNEYETGEKWINRKYLLFSSTNIHIIYCFVSENFPTYVIADQKTFDQNKYSSFTSLMYTSRACCTVVFFVVASYIREVLILNKSIKYNSVSLSYH